MPQIKLNTNCFAFHKEIPGKMQHTWILDTETKLMYLHQVIRNEITPVGSWPLESFLTKNSLTIGNGWIIIQGLQKVVIEANLHLSANNKLVRDISTQTAVIRALHTNTCPLCSRNKMCADVVHSYGRKHKVAYFVECLFCCNRWEITKEIFEEEVKVSETKSYKLEEDEKSGTDEN
jgi:hypothetical protein